VRGGAVAARCRHYLAQPQWAMGRPDLAGVITAPSAATYLHWPGRNIRYRSRLPGANDAERVLTRLAWRQLDLQPLRPPDHL
jgi:hypothetical protein